MTAGEDSNSQYRNLVWKISEAIADSRGVEPSELDLRLAEYINIEAVNELTDDQNSTWTLTFEIPEQTVTVTSNGQIRVDADQENDYIDTSVNAHAQ